jgi:hypothetical protein
MNERPISTLIFGILNIGDGIWNMGGPLFALAMSKLKLPGHSGFVAVAADPTYAALMKFNIWAHAVLGLALMAFGIGLLLLQNWARLGSIVYSVIDIVLVVVLSMVMWPLAKRMMEQMPGLPPGMMAGFAALGLLLEILFELAYPVLLLYFMTRSNVIEACQRKEPAATA